VFWEANGLDALTPAQWEALCDRCGRCCLEKLTDRKTGKVFYTSVPCRLLDTEMGTCRNYAERTAAVPSCQRLTPATIAACRWLPQSCAYRRLAEGRSLPDWHPLVSGEAASVHRAGISVRGLALRTDLPAHYDLADYIVDWGIWRRWRRPNRRAD
jgi:uncharacterized cysteine cluster protein YcgN (CxxCxxCC family)